jgi:hypothetical protein
MVPSRPLCQRIAPHRVKIKISTMVTTADNSKEPKQPNRFEKKKNIWRVPFQGWAQADALEFPPHATLCARLN